MRDVYFVLKKSPKDPTSESLSSMIFITGCPTKLFPLFFLIFQLPLGLETQSWTFFNSPFPEDCRNVNFLSFGEIGVEISAKYYREMILKVDNFCFLFNEAVQHS